MEPPPPLPEIQPRFEDEDATCHSTDDEEEISEDALAGGSGELVRPSKPFWDQHPFSTLIRGWGMDPFAAYALALAYLDALKTQSRPTAPGESGYYFWFPFAYSNSQFYRDMFTSPTMREAVTSDPSKSLAVRLGRYQDGLKCIKSRLGSENVQVAAGLNVVTAVIGLICYNVSAQRILWSFPLMMPLVCNTRL